MTTVLTFPTTGRWSWFAPNSVACPKCKEPGGEPCLSTGGGNTEVVATHKARRDRVAGWSEEFSGRAGWTARRYQHRNGETWPADAFAEFEAAAAPVVVKAAKPLTPKGVRLSETQAEEIERYVMAGGYGSVSTAHFHGDAQHRQTVNALEAKGIVEQVGEPTAYDRRMKLTEFGWAVYREHRLIIKRLSDEQVAEQIARAEEGRCLECGLAPGAGASCGSCDLTQFSTASDVIADFNRHHPVGSKVKFWPGVREGEPRVSVTRTGARLLGDHTPVVWIEGHSGCIALTHVQVIDAGSCYCGKPYSGPECITCHNDAEIAVARSCDV